MITLKPYQETKVDELIKAVSDFINLEASNKICVFQSPTGSGKTVMMAKDLMYMDIKCFALEEDGTLFLMDKCGNFAYCPPDRFTVVFIGDDGMWVRGKP